MPDAEPSTASRSTTLSPKPSACARPRSSSPPNARMGAAGGRHDDRLRDIGHRLRLRGGIDRALPASATPDARPGVRVLLFAVSTGELETQLINAARPMRAHLPGTACLCRPRRRRAAQARRGDPLFRRRLADLQNARRQTLLAHPGHGRRVRVRGDDRPDQGGGRRRQSADHGGSSANDACRGRSRRRRRSPRCRTSSCRSPAASCARAPRSARNTRACPPPPTTPIARL